jgi:glycosyltransferase involved in cell wall biosynthesis
MEAMACGAAMVTYDNGGCRDYALDGQTALVARRRDVADLAEKIERLVVDPAFRAKIAHEGRTFIRWEFDWERAVTRMETILHRVS